MCDPLLAIKNHHSASCGDPPIVSDEAYTGYFEGPYGDQWIFTYNRNTKEAVLQGGDVGWNNRYDVQDGVVPNLILNQAEAMWLAACWSAAIGE